MMSQAVSCLYWALAAGLAICSSQSHADYDATILDQSTGANFTLNVDGKSSNLGEVGAAVVDSSTVKGIVRCGAGDLSYTKGYHRVFINLPKDSSGHYRINEYLSMTYSSTISADAWSKLGEKLTCTKENYLVEAPAAGFAKAFPITFTFFLDKKPAGNTVVLPNILLGGYIRRFSSAAPGGIAPAVYTIPFHLTGGLLVMPSSCNANVNTLELNHKTVSSNASSNLISAPITYTCASPSAVKGTFTLGYTKNANGRLDMVDSRGKVKAQALLTIKDNATGAYGQSIKSDITGSKTFTITSSINNFTGEGAIQGSAWLMASFD